MTVKPTAATYASLVWKAPVEDGKPAPSTGELWSPTTWTTPESDVADEPDTAPSAAVLEDRAKRAALAAAKRERLARVAVVAHHGTPDTYGVRATERLESAPGVPILVAVSPSDGRTIRHGTKHRTLNAARALRTVRTPKCGPCYVALAAAEKDHAASLRYVSEALVALCDARTKLSVAVLEPVVAACERREAEAKARLRAMHNRQALTGRALNVAQDALFAASIGL